ncbi:MAG: MaoC family dehydratase [Haloferacaceae archaeon]
MTDDELPEGPDYFAGDEFYEDVEVGRTYECGSVTVSEEDIVSFAEQFDPLTMHTDPERAEESPHRGLIASGYHTLSLTVSLLVEGYRGDRAVIAGLSIDDVTWHRPVRPGDTLTATITMDEKRRSSGDPANGIVTMSVETRNQDGDLVLSYTDTELVRVRDPAAAGDAEGEGEGEGEE